MDGMLFRMIPALDGTLYTFNGRQIAQLPISADSLLRSSHKIGDDVLAAGRSDNKWFGIRLSDGSLLYECSFDDCQPNNENESTSDEVLIVQKKSHGVRAVDPRTGKEKWNMFTSQFKISLSRSEPDCVTNYDNEVDEDESVMLGLSNSELVFVSNENGTIKSKKKFSSPIAAAWLVKDAHLSVIDPFAPISKTDDVREGIYIGQADGQLYIQPSLSRHSLQVIDVAPQTDSPAQIEYKPSKSTRPAATSGKEVAVVLENDLTLGPGFIYRRNCDVIESAHDELVTNTSFDDFLDDNEYDSIDHIIVVSLWHWWKEILGISLCLAILINLIAHYLKNRVQDCLDCESACDDDDCPNPRHRKTGNSSSRVNVSLENSNPLSLTSVPTATSSSPIQSERPFISRFESDYENIHCRGRGGFGVVFEARKKLESVSYAVKRIRMPSKPELQEKVMREVKALANMNHQNIVRYYTSWTEDPPLGWQQDFDHRILSSDPHDESFTSESNKSSISAMSTQDHAVGHHQVANKKMIDSICEEDSLRLPADQTQASQDSYVVFADDTNVSKAASPVQSFSKPLQPIRQASKERQRHKHAAVPKTFLYIQMELCAKQTLREWLQENNTSSLRDRGKVLAIFRQIVEAVDYVHSSGLMHRDLKPSNIFFSSDGAVKVGDFGLVTAAVEGCDSSVSSNDSPSLTLIQSSNSSSETVNHTDNVGTFLYMSPDQLECVSYSNKVDIYSLGIILYELLVPFRTEMERLHTLKHVRELSFPQSFSKKFTAESQLLRQMLASAPSDRPSANEILSHDILPKHAAVFPDRLTVDSSRRRTISITDSGEQK